VYGTLTGYGVTVSCNWPIDESCFPALPEESSGDDPVYDAAVLSLESAKALAVEVLWALSGRQFCLQEMVVRPCLDNLGTAQRLRYESAYELFSWYDQGWRLVNCGCANGCVASGPGMVHLDGPVNSVQEVWIAGELLDESEYVLEGDILYRTGASWWPSQDMSRPAGEPGTWEVTYLRGFEPPAGTAKLAGLLTAEFYQACTGGKCRLPRSVSEVSRQGVTHRVVNPSDIYSTGKTGIPEIDLWLAAVNPNRLISAPIVL
jgi:hypothetical protein